MLIKNPDLTQGWRMGSLPFTGPHSVPSVVILPAGLLQQRELGGQRCGAGLSKKQSILLIVPPEPLPAVSPEPPARKPTVQPAATVTLRGPCGVCAGPRWN